MALTARRRRARKPAPRADVGRLPTGGSIGGPGLTATSPVRARRPGLTATSPVRRRRPRNLTPSGPIRRRKPGLTPSGPVRRRRPPTMRKY